MKKEFILLSGGLDSSLLAFDLKRIQKKDVAAIYIDHGQLAANQEKKSAEKVAEILNIDLKIIDISGIWPSFKDVAKDTHIHIMTSSAISASPGIIIGANYAAWAGSKKLYIGLVKEDIDGRPWLLELIANYNKAVSCIKPSLKEFPLGGDEFSNFELLTPFSNLYKHEIIEQSTKSADHGDASDLQDIIQSSWSCQFSNSVRECGECYICKTKTAAIETASLLVI